jgi:DNA-binding transcriptional regulator GbsR (MarR family)
MINIENVTSEEECVESFLDIRITRNREGGFFTIDNIFVDEIARKCKPHTTSVYLALCRHVDIDKQTCFPSKDLIAKETGMSVRTVGSAIKKLEKLGLVHIQHSKKQNGLYYSNFYTLLNIVNDNLSLVVKPTVGNKEQAPQAINNTTHGHILPNKETNIKETNNKESSKDSNKILLKKYKPEFLIRKEVLKDSTPSENVTDELK